MKYKFFTLIELLVVIVILSILAAIVIPNTQGVQKDATKTAILSDLKNLQTSVDMYGLKNDGSIPSSTEPTEFFPQPLDFQSLYPKYLRNLPKTKGLKYWVDINSKVWISTIDSPTGVTKSDTLLKWDLMEEADRFNIYEVKGTNSATSAVTGSSISYRFVDSSTNNQFTVSKDKEYVVSAIDKQGFETAPSGVGYVGYQNQRPIPVISFSPNTNLDTTTKITWETKGSYDPDGDTIVSVEWRGKEEIYSTAGTYTVQLRVKDSKGLWSEWTKVDIQVASASFTPTKVSAAKTLTTSDVFNNIDIEADANGNIYYFWVQNYRVYYKVLDLNGTVLKPKQLLSQTNIDSMNWNVDLKSFDAVLDKQGNIYLNYQINGFTYISKFDKNGTVLIKDKQIYAKSQFAYGGRYNVSFTIHNDIIYMTARDWGGEGGNGDKVYIYKLDRNLNQIGNRILFAYTSSFYESQILVTDSRIYVLYSGYAYTSGEFSTTLTHFDHLGKDIKTMTGRPSNQDGTTRRFVGDFEFDTNGSLWLIDNNAWNENYDINAYLTNSSATSISSTLRLHSGLMDGYVRAVRLPDGKILFTYKESGQIKYKTLEK